MDASAYLHRQGWRGHGHSLDHTDRGIKKPLLVSKKVDVLGVGLDKHKAVSDQWWLRAFDEGLKSLRSGRESALAQVQKHGVHRGGLYGRFVKGDGIGGTIGERSLPSTDISTLATPETATPAEPVNSAAETDDMAIDIPATDKLDRKRKRAEDPVEKHARRKNERAVKEAGVTEVATGEAAVMEAERVRKQKERKKKTAVEKAETARIIAERNGEAQAGVTVFNDHRPPTTSGFGNRSEEVPRGITNSRSLKRKLPPEKLNQYQKRADAKRISLETYMERRDEKFAVKQAEKLGKPHQANLHAVVYGGDARPVTAPATLGVANGFSADELGFVVDTTGDTALSAENAFIGTAGKPLALAGTVDIEQYRNTPSMPVPLNPRIWEGQNVKDLPRPVREARRQWMAQRREARKAASLSTSDPVEARKMQKAKKRQKETRKVEAREAFVKQILFESRKGKNKGRLVEIDGVKEVPLVKLKSKKGTFSKEEVMLARKAARRVLRNVRREEKAAKRKGKMLRKREGGS